MHSTCPVCHEMTNAILFRTKQDDTRHGNAVAASCCGFLFPAAKCITISQKFSLSYKNSYFFVLIFFKVMLKNWILLLQLERVVEMRHHQCEMLQCARKWCRTDLTVVFGLQSKSIHPSLDVAILLCLYEFYWWGTNNSRGLTLPCENSAARPLFVACMPYWQTRMIGCKIGTFLN